MNERELRDIWKNSSKKEEVTVHMEQLIKQFKSGMESRERIVRRRDNREIFLAILAIGPFTAATIDLWNSISSFGMLCIVISYGYFIYKLRSNRKSKHTHRLFLPIKEQLQQQKRFMLNQAKLLDTVLYWAALPFFVGYMIVVWGVWDLNAYDFSKYLDAILPVELKSKIVYTLVFAAMFAYMVWTNKKAVKVNWNPLIAQIDAILDNLDKEEN